MAQKENEEKLNPLSADQIVEAMTSTIKDVYAEGREVQPAVYIHAAGCMKSLPYMKGTEFEGVSKRVIIMAIIAARSLQLFEGAAMVSEVWGLRGKPGQREEDMPLPSESPDRQEAVLVHAYGGDGSKRFVVWPMLREGKTVRMGEPPLMDTKVKGSAIGWLDEAFEDQVGEA